MLKQANIVIVLLGVLTFKYNFSYFSNVKVLFFSNFIFTLCIPVICAIVSSIHFGFFYVELTFNIVLMSLLSFSLFFIYSLVWRFIILGILYSSKIFLNNFKLTIICGIIFIILQTVQYYFDFYVLRNFSCYALSKEIVIFNFKYWEVGSWVYNANIGFPYANVSVFYPEQTNLILVSVVLLFYILLSNCLLMFKFKQEKTAQSFGFIGIPDDETLGFLSKQLNLQVRTKNFKRFKFIIIGNGFKSKIFIYKIY